MKPAPVLLVDTGPLVALLDGGDPAHSLVTRAWLPLRGRFVTTGAVLTETFHFMEGITGGATRLAEGVAKGHITIEEMFAPADLLAAAALMTRYADTPMDFADATLVLLAERLGAPHVLTLDERGFRAYRHGRNKPFRLVIQDGLLP